MANSEPKIFKELREVKTAAAVMALIPQFTQERMLTQQKFDALENSREDAILSGQSAREKLRAQVEEVKGYLDDLDAASRVAERLLMKFKDDEALANLEAASKQATADVEKISEHQAKFLKLVLEASKIRKECSQIQERVRTFAHLAGQAKRPDLKPPLDPKRKAFEEKKLPFDHPLNSLQFQTAFETLPRFVTHCEQAGVEV